MGDEQMWSTEVVAFKKKLCLKYKTRYHTNVLPELDHCDQNFQPPNKYKTVSLMIDTNLLLTDSQKLQSNQSLTYSKNWWISPLANLMYFCEVG